MTIIDKAALLAKVKASGEDQTKIEEFKDSGPVLVEGLHNARFVAYIEVGKHSAMYQGKPKKTPDDLVYLGFEFSGPKVVPREDGQPIVLFIKANKSFNSKSGFPKIMTRMNYAGKATHMAELLGEPYQIMISHSKKKTEDGKERTYVNMKKAGEPHDIRAPRYEVQDENGPTGEFKIINVAPAKAKEMVFLWDFADMAQWQSIFIDGEYAERKDENTGEVTKPAKSKNFYQSLIKSAKNFNGSPIHTLLVAGGVSLDIPDAEAPGQAGEDDDTPDETTAVGTKAPVDTPTGAAADDALSGVA